MWGWSLVRVSLLARPTWKRSRLRLMSCINSKYRTLPAAPPCQQEGPAATDCSLSLTEWFRAKEVTSLSFSPATPLYPCWLSLAASPWSRWVQRKKRRESEHLIKYFATSRGSQVLPARRSFGSLAAHFIKRITMWFIIKMKPTTWWESVF